MHKLKLLWKETSLGRVLKSIHHLSLSDYTVKLYILVWTAKDLEVTGLSEQTFLEASSKLSVSHKSKFEDYKQNV